MKGLPEVVHCIESHHGEVEQRTIDAVIAQIADGISGGRLGRAESLETYIKRSSASREICTSYRAWEGLRDAGRLRGPRDGQAEDVDDLSGTGDGADIASRSRRSCSIPGRSRSVVRETRSVEYAK